MIFVVPIPLPFPSVDSKLYFFNQTCRMEMSVELASKICEIESY